MMLPPQNLPKQFCSSSRLSLDYKSGMTQREIAEKYGVHQITVSRAMRRHGIKAKYKNQGYK